MTKHIDGKPKIELVEPDFIIEVAKVLTHGANRYGVEDWKNTENARNEYYGAAQRHLLAYRKGKTASPEGFSHLAHAAANIMFLHWIERGGDD